MSLERIDPHFGYHLWNCVLVCLEFNVRKTGSRPRRPRAEATWLRGGPYSNIWKDMFHIYLIIGSSEMHYLFNEGRFRPDITRHQPMPYGFLDIASTLSVRAAQEATAAANIGRTSKATARPTASRRPRRRSSPSATAFIWRPSRRAAGLMSSIAAARRASSACSTRRRWRSPTFAAIGNTSAPAISRPTTAPH